MIARLKEHQVQVVWAAVCFVMGLVGSLIGGFLGQLIF